MVWTSRTIDPGADLLDLLKPEVSLWKGKLSCRHGGSKPMGPIHDDGQPSTS